MGALPPGSGAADGPAVGQISCSMASTLVRHVRTQAGDDAVNEILRRSGVEHSAAYLDDPSNWIWQHEAIELLIAASEVLDDPEIGLHVGEQTVRQHAGTPVATMLRSLGSPEAVYEQLTVAVSKFSTTTDLHPEVEPGRATVSARSRNGFSRHPLMCDWTKGLLSQPPALFGAPPAAPRPSPAPPPRAWRSRSAGPAATPPAATASAGTPSSRPPIRSCSP